MQLIVLMSLADLIMFGLPIAGIALVFMNIGIRIDEWRRLERLKDPEERREP